MIEYGGARGEPGIVGCLISEHDLNRTVVDDDDPRPAPVEQREGLVADRPISDLHAFEVRVGAAAWNGPCGQEIDLPGGVRVHLELQFAVGHGAQPRVVDEPPVYIAGQSVE